MVGSVRYASKYAALALVLVILVQLPFAQPVSQLWAGRRHTTLDTTGFRPSEGSLCGIRHNPTFNLPFARAPLQNTRLWTSNYTWHAKAQMVAVEQWYHDNDLSTVNTHADPAAGPAITAGFGRCSLDGREIPLADGHMPEQFALG